MRGVGTATGAISIVNALPTGVGAAVGVDLPVRAELELHPSGSSEKWDVQIADDSRSPLVIEALTQALRRLAPGTSGHGTLSIRSTVPIGRGLKSSSAVSSAVVLAVARAVETPVTAVDVARLSAQASIVAGVSATGAFDDALAGLEGGGVVTDNRRDVCLRRLELRAGLGAVLWIPEGSHPRAPSLVRAFGRRRGLARRAVDAAMDGDWPEAMALNSRLVEEVMGYRYDGLHRAAKAAGAIASGVSGLGPAFAAVAPLARLPRLRRALPSLGGRRRTVGLLSRLPGTVREA